MSYGQPAAEPSIEIPVCPRHPDRISYVRCQRCGRPACPECQRTAAVGVQCVDCVHEQARARSTGVSGPYGGAPAAGGRAIVTYVMIGLCIAVYLLQLVLPDDFMYQQFAYAPVTTETEPWRMLTSAFLHSQGLILHIAFNMYALWIIGRALEPLVGHARYLALYLLSAFGGSVGYLLFNSLSDNSGVVGASGAVFGLFGALFVVQRHRGGDIRGLLWLIGINFALGFIAPGIAWQAHLGGLVTGGLAAALVVYVPRSAQRSLIQWAGMAALLAVLVAATYAKVAAG